MRKDDDQSKWTGVKIQQNVSINFTSIFISWWKGVLQTTAGINPNLSSQYSVKLWSSSYWGQWNAGSVGDGWGHRAVQLIKRPLGYQLKRSNISITAELQAMSWLLVFLEHMRIKGLKQRIKIIPNRQVVAGCQERAQATKSVASFLRHDRMNVT